MKKLFKNKNIRYNLMYVGMKIGVVSEKKWLEYIDGIFTNLLKEHEEVFKRMKFK
jgi:hypothetical protein